MRIQILAHSLMGNRNSSRPDPQPKRREPVFLLSPPRSYSTVTMALLGGHPGIYSFPEMLLFTSDTVGHLFNRPTKPGRPLGWASSQRSGIVRAVADLMMASQEDEAIIRARHWLEARASWSPCNLMDYLLERVHPRIGLEKSPETVQTTEALDDCVAHYPEARYIHLTRHPADTMRSAIEHWRTRPARDEHTRVSTAASSWYLGHARIMRKMAELPPAQWIRIRAEDLLGDPEMQLPYLLGWLGLEADKDVIAFMKHTENWRFAGTGTSGRLFGGDPKFLRSPTLRPVSPPGAVVFDESWNMPTQMTEPMTALASYLGY